MATVQERKYVGQSVEKADALERVTGRAQYGADLYMSGMLYAKALRSPYAHARIKNIDTSKAEQVEGVKAVITHKDLPVPSDTATSFGGELMIALKDLQKLTMAHDKALFDGHPVAVVAATSQDVAEYAASLVQVEYEPLPPVTDVVSAMDDSAATGRAGQPAARGSPFHDPAPRPGRGPRQGSGGKAKDRDPQAAFRGADPSRHRRPYYRPRDRPGASQRRAGQVLRWGHYAQAEAAGKAERGQATVKDGWERGGAAGGLSHAAQDRQLVTLHPQSFP